VLRESDHLCAVLLRKFSTRALKRCSTLGHQIPDLFSDPPG